MSQISCDKPKGWYWEEQPAKFIFEKFLENKLNLICPNVQCRVKRLFIKDCNGIGEKIKPKFRCTHCKSRYDVLDFYLNIIKGNIKKLPKKTSQNGEGMESNIKSGCISINTNTGIEISKDVSCNIDGYFSESDNSSEQLNLTVESHEIFDLTENPIKKELKRPHSPYGYMDKKLDKNSPLQNYSLVKKDSHSSSNSTPIAIKKLKVIGTSTDGQSISNNSHSVNECKFNEKYATVSELDKKLISLKLDLERSLQDQKSKCCNSTTSCMDLIDDVFSQIDNLSDKVDDKIKAYNEVGVSKIEKLTSEQATIRGRLDALTREVCRNIDSLDELQNFVDMNNHIESSCDSKNPENSIRALSKTDGKIKKSQKSFDLIEPSFDYETFLVKMRLVGFNIFNPSPDCDLRYHLIRLYVKGIVKLDSEELKKCLTVLGFDLNYIPSISSVSKNVHEFTVFMEYAPEFCAKVNENTFITLLTTYDPLMPDFPNPDPQMVKDKISSYIYKLKLNIEESLSDQYIKYVVDLIRHIEESINLS
ncbi:hypothetical protein AYI68_g2281 [Smittium mucronatum]|uniref:Uncharacterized protein n=1 Tax=Smittium mucronatum TaxID=133383 RepID=A0A1R0H381_9FUNG|nr:hypothetical protein AYI68_g2281 [Smittium mucronatum]